VRIMLTGYADRASVSRAFSDAEIHELVSKPWDDEELKQILRNALDQSAGHY
jgi:response regulator RpfG family c-di-GMP phosphodiesterase